MNIRSNDSSDFYIYSDKSGSSLTVPKCVGTSSSAKVYACSKKDSNAQLLRREAQSHESQRKSECRLCRRGIPLGTTNRRLRRIGIPKWISDLSFMVSNRCTVDGLFEGLGCSPTISPDPDERKTQSNGTTNYTESSAKEPLHGTAASLGASILCRFRPIANQRISNKSGVRVYCLRGQNGASRSFVSEQSYEGVFSTATCGSPSAS